MPYKLNILNEARKPIGGEITLYDAGGAVVGFITVPVSGAVIGEQQTSVFNYALVTSPGYVGLSVPYIHEDTDYILVKKQSIGIALGIGVLVAIIGMKLIK